MVFECEFRPGYLANANNVQQAIGDALMDIKTNLAPEAVLPQGLVIRRIRKNEAIALGKGGIRGEWNQITKQLLLVEGEWCVSTLVHETLHAVSSIQTLDEALQLRPLFEGLTECLTGYVLYKKYPYAYSNCWKTDERVTWCRISDLYRPNCKRWGAFFHFMPVETISPIYFDSPPNWTNMCSNFAAAVKAAGYIKFQDVLGNVLTSHVSDLTFWAECRRVFGKKFTVISGTPAALDFSNVKH
jgi:hypothetical protein